MRRDLSTGLLLLFSIQYLTALHNGSCLGLVCGHNGNCHEGPKNGTQNTYWCRCNEGFYGVYCERRCDLNCGSNQKCVFNDEIQKTLCVCKDCDQNGLSLLKPNCPPGYGGEKCTISGWCYPEKCKNGGRCVGSGTDAKCVCPDGFKGEKCELDVNECEVKQDACGPRSTCMNTNGSYLCVCPQGFLPPDCLTPGNSTVVEFKPTVCFVDISPEHPNGTSMFCQNGGYCEKALSRCHCPPGYRGSTCEITPESEAEDPCSSNPCIHGSCSSFAGGFQCLCDDGFSGSYCQDGRNHCVENKCEAGSKCINDVSSYFCDCPPGRTGQFCEKMDCSAVPGICNHGRCIDNPFSEKSFECQCQPGWEGNLCDSDKNECLSRNMCLNNGTCVNLPGTFRCDCARGFGGIWCDQPVDMCQDVECMNGGKCLHTSDHSPVCQCRNGFIGKRCEKQCPPGFGGVRCDLRKPTGICSKTGPKCFNGGMCSSGFCVCQPDFTGNQCEISRNEVTSSQNLCQSDPCMNNATCIDVDAHIGYACICQQGFEGDICERRKDICLENPCANGGTCHQNRESFSCECPSGFYGERCELEKRFFCTNSSCKNGGVCLRNGTATKCECSYGYTGNRCEEKINLNIFSNQDAVFRTVCEKRKCWERANDGNCDDDCNFSACRFDGGDCSGKRQPFSKCKYGNMCADLFANGQCNQACNNEECLYDGMDCMPAVVRCPAKIREYCAARFANGICDTECNTNGCGFDGGDCDNKTESAPLKDIRITVQMDPTEFQNNGGNSLMEISSALRATVRIQRDLEGPLVFEWDGEKEQKRVKMDMKKLSEQQVLSTSIRKVRSAIGGKGVVVYLEVQENCSHGKCLYKDSQTVVDLISARLAKKGIDSFGVPISEALVSTPRKSGGESSGSLNSFVFLIGGCIAVILLIAGIMKVEEIRNRKRRMITAKTWTPPMENEDKNRRNQSINSSQHSLLDPTAGYYDPKRHRAEFDLASQPHGEYNQFFPQPFINGNGYMTDYGGSVTPMLRLPTTTVHQVSSIKVEEETEVLTKLHEQAAGPDPITEQINKKSVNVKDPKYKRNVLHFLAANSTGKQEELIVQEAKQCFAVGGKVNEMDCDENTPLMLAVKARRARLVLYLLKAKADPSIYNKSERNALHEAVINRDSQIMKYLLTNERIIKDIEELDRNGMTALMIVACKEGDDQLISMAKLLLIHGAKIDSDGAGRKDSEIYRGRTAFHYAALIGNLPMVEFLVNENANKDKQDEEGRTPIMLAAKEGHRDTVAYLIQRGASVEVVDALDHTARQLARANHHHDVVELFDNVHFQPSPHLDFFNGMDIHHQQIHSQPATSTRKNGFIKKSAKKAAGRTKKEAVSSSRDSTHLTPPPSDGSTSSPSPQHFMTATTHTTPTSLHYMSPEYQFDYSSEAFHPQCSALPNNGMGYTASPMLNEPMMRHAEPAHHYY
uniref:Notch-like transmembrane receptor LIN-12 n=1 Tax=Caenorhabditis remanei TaxID=31234 RepID=Q86FJ9_CAERE|nr:notch-like transmembrane receptor LIN-12 [Caenorhabditis remanei]